MIKYLVKSKLPKFCKNFFSGMERLCACTVNGTLHFFKMTNEDDSTEEKDVEDFNMITDSITCDIERDVSAPSTSKSNFVNQWVYGF